MLKLRFFFTSYSCFLQQYLLFVALLSAMVHDSPTSPERPPHPAGEAAVEDTPDRHPDVVADPETEPKALRCFKAYNAKVKDARAAARAAVPSATKKLKNAQNDAAKRARLVQAPMYNVGLEGRLTCGDAAFLEGAPLKVGDSVQAFYRKQWYNGELESLSYNSVHMFYHVAFSIDGCPKTARCFHRAFVSVPE